MDGKEKIKAALQDLDSAIETNDCGMGSSTFVILAVFIREIVKFAKRKRYLSTDEAARMLGGESSHTQKACGGGIDTTSETLRPP